MSDVQCPCTLAVQFPSDVFRAGSAQVLPELVKSLDLPNVRAIQFVPNGVVRVTFKEPTQCDAALANGISFRGSPLCLTTVDSRTRLVYVRDLPVEVPDDGLQAFLRPFGVVHSVLRQTYPGMPDVFTGTRVVKVTLSKDLPSSARVSGFDVRFWYRSQPRACPVCRAFGHRVKDCPFNGKCRRCSQPGHMARECPSRRITVEPASAVPPEPPVEPVSTVPPAPEEFLPGCSLATALPGRKRSFSETDTCLLYYSEDDLVPEDPVPVSDPVSDDPVPATVESTPAVPDVPVSASADLGTPVSASVPVPEAKKPRSSDDSPSFWVISRCRQHSVNVVDAAGEPIELEYGYLTRSILRDSSTFEVARFCKYRDGLVSRPYLVPRDIPCSSLRPGVPLKFPKSKKSPKSLSGWFS